MSQIRRGLELRCPHGLGQLGRNMRPERLASSKGFSDKQMENEERGDIKSYTSTSGNVDGSMAREREAVVVSFRAGMTGKMR
ncbi:hypothetical protein PAMP_020120 [Pampus punctatissimus]